MGAKPLPPQDILRRMFVYEPETGFLFHTGCNIVKITPMRRKGKHAFTSKTRRGYYRGGLLGRNVMAHRVVWKWHFDTEPDEIDHINGDPSDNRIENLRAATRQDNVRNTCIRKCNKSGVQGVYWHNAKSRWVASIRHGGKQIEIGTFLDLEAAAGARKAAEKQFGYHSNHGRPAHG